uniref:Uncharacterized protein n=1 Tax=Euplotes harpa TaxID=151035 RepID=A0A7S3JL43_9SPIT|mmetsp:Transcript_7444/g.8406  ORF Transcript_7444/g.8406 Transcript_7444/m.8406 type:complete len:182 (+) Transcript_7444:116-661(+)
MKAFLEFIENCSPMKLKHFVLNWYSSGYWGDYTLNMQECLDAISPLLGRVEEEIFLYECNFDSSATFSQFMIASRKCRQVVVRSCVLNFECTCNFGEDNIYCTEVLSLGHDKLKDRCGWHQNTNAFNSLCKGIQKSSLKASLKEIVISEKSITLESAKQILKTLGLENIAVSVGKTDPMVE